MTTIVKTGNFIEITAIDADVPPEDIFGASGAHPEGNKVKRIEFVAGSNNDVCVLKQLTDAGATIATLSSPDVELVDRVYFDYGGQYMRPMIDLTDSALNTNHKLVIELA
jgi:hypothetical protein